MMMKAIKSIRIGVVIFVVVAFMGCSGNNNTLKVTFSKTHQDSLSMSGIYGLEVVTKDSVSLFSRTPMLFSDKDTLRLDSLHDGIYDVRYNDMWGNVKTRRVVLKNDQTKSINIISDSLNAARFYNKTPIANLKEGKSYRIEIRGMGSSYAYYELKKARGQTYLSSIWGDAGVLTNAEIEKIKQYEAELLAIEGSKNCNSTANFTYSIIIEKDTTDITDNSCNWNGWHYTIEPILKSRFKE